MADSISTLHLERAESVHSANEQLRQIVKEQKSANEQLRRDLALEKATNEALQQSLAECQERQALQPPAEDSAALLQELQARLEEQHKHELKKQAERIVEAYRRDVEALEALEGHKNAQLVNASAKAVKEQGRLQEVIFGLKEDLEAIHAELERRGEAFRGGSNIFRIRKGTIWRK